MNKSRILVAPADAALRHTETMFHLGIAKHHSLMTKKPLEVRTPTNAEEHLTLVSQKNKTKQKIFF